MHSLHFIRSHSSLLGAKPWIKYVSRFYNKEEGTNFDFDRVNSWNGWCLLVIKLGYFPGVLLQYLQLDEVGTLMVSRKYESFNLKLSQKSERLFRKWWRSETDRSSIMPMYCIPLTSINLYLPWVMAGDTSKNVVDEGKNRHRDWSTAIRQNN